MMECHVWHCLTHNGVYTLVQLPLAACDDRPAMLRDGGMDVGVAG